MSPTRRSGQSSWVPGQPLPFDHTHALWQGSPHDGRGVIHVVSRKKSAVTEKGPYVTYNPLAYVRIIIV